MSSSPMILAELSRRCPGGHEHDPMEGGRTTKASAIYPPMLCRAILRGAEAQRRADGLPVPAGVSQLLAAGLDEYIKDSSKLAGQYDRTSKKPDTDKYSHEKTAAVDGSLDAAALAALDSDEEVTAIVCDGCEGEFEIAPDFDPPDGCWYCEACARRPAGVSHTRKRLPVEQLDLASGVSINKFGSLRQAAAALGSASSIDQARQAIGRAVKVSVRMRVHSIARAW